jgi:hypothetical protein
MARTKPRRTAPPRKISETFLEFVAPLTSQLGPTATEAELEQALKIGFIVWNAVVFDALEPGGHHVDEALRLTAQHEPVRQLTEYLIDHKRRHFKNDLRLIGNYQLYRNRGELRLRAEARSLKAWPSAGGLKTTDVV